MVSKESFTLLVDTKTIPIFVVVPIYFVQDCRLLLVYECSYVNSNTGLLLVPISKVGGHGTRLVYKLT